MQYILALDQGTTSSRAIVFDRAGRIASSAQQEFPQIFPQPGWVEHDATAIWSTQLAVARQALRKLGATPADIAGIGITNQRETTVLWDRATGQPVANAIVWQDRRTAARCDALREDQGQGRAGAAQNRADAGRLFFGHQTGVDAGPRARCAPACRARRAGLWHRGQLAGLEPDGRAPACHRCQQCLAHAAVQHSHPAVGRCAAGAVSHSAQRVAHRGAIQQRAGRDGCCGVWRAHRHCRHGR